MCAVLDRGNLLPQMRACWRHWPWYRDSLQQDRVAWPVTASVHSLIPINHRQWSVSYSLFSTGQSHNGVTWQTKDTVMHGEDYVSLQRLDWIEQCFTSPPTQYRLYGRRFLQVKRPNQQYQSTEETNSTQTNQTYNKQPWTQNTASPLVYNNMRWLVDGSHRGRVARPEWRWGCWRGTPNKHVKINLSSTISVTLHRPTKCSVPRTVTSLSRHSYLLNCSRCPPDSPKLDLRKPFRRTLKKYSCFVEKKSYSVSSITYLVRTFCYCNSEPSQHS